MRDAVLARAARLSPVARRALSAAAVLGRRAGVRLVAEVAGEPATAVDECVALGVLVEAGGDSDDGDVVFRHELARLAVEQSLGPAARSDLHSRALAALIRYGPPDDRALAHHASGCGDDALVLIYAPRAAEHAARLGAHREAAAHYRRALRVPDAGPDVRARLFEALSYECYLTDELAEAVTARRRSLELLELAGDAAGVGAAERWLSRLSWFLGLTEDARRYGHRAVATLEPLGDGHELAMAYSNLAQIGMLADDVTAALDWGGRALELARSLGDRDVEIHALNNTGTALWAVGDDLEGRSRLTRSLDLALADGAHEHAARAYTNLGTMAARHRRWTDADRELRAGIAYCEDHDLDSWSHYMSAALATSLAEQGRFDDALASAEAVLRHSRVAAVSRIPAIVATARIRALRGEPDPALLADAATLAARTGEIQRLAPVAAAQAEAAWLADDPDGIVAGVDLAWSAAVEHPEPWAVGELAFWLSVAGAARATPAVPAAPFALMLCGAWEEAASAWAGLGCPLWVAICLGNVTESGTARRALTILDDLGAPAARAAVLRERRARDLTLPRTPRTSSRDNPAQLTARELDVLRLVAGGLSNLEVAGTLFISEKTVGHHMSAVLRKLDQPTRARAVAQALRTGIVDPT